MSRQDLQQALESWLFAEAEMSRRLQALVDRVMLELDAVPEKPTVAPRFLEAKDDAHGDV